ncbi:hypothetical protein BC831DRAFT_14474 [Entophlyctis helioformis]|nr:hypothetical protein BC831DRAFT_14474 [Entophlyctis helioformis]
MHGLSQAQVERYSRQLLLRDIGVAGQERLCNAKVLVVGAGGIGSPVILYLAAAGIGHLGIVDYDSVEASNLQRQVVHTEARVGTLKADSAAQAVAELSSLVKCTTFNTLIDRTNVLDIVREFDIIVDATDNVATRYLLNDASVLLNKTLVSGSALRMDGQLTVYNHQGGPCYRCIFPVPPPPETVTNCSEGGVLGVVPGIIGCIQALEVIKLVAGIPTSYSQKLLLFDAVAGSFRSVKLRGKSPNCAVCGDNPTITEPIDYVQFCGSAPDDKTPDVHLLEPHERVSVQAYRDVADSGAPHVLVDVRDQMQFEICALPNSLHVPFDKLQERLPEIVQHRSRVALDTGTQTPPPVFVVCRRGNDSQMAVRTLKAGGIESAFDIIGGLEEWSRTIDPTFPNYG